MKSILLLLLFTSLHFIGKAQAMKMNDESTDVTFEAKHLAGWLGGTIKGVIGTAELDSTKMENAYLRFSISPATFIHNENYLGPNLFKENCFDTKKNPEINLVSSSITRLKGVNKYQFRGALIIKGKSRDITFQFSAVPNVGGYDYDFQFFIIKKTYELKCAFSKKLLIKVRAYAKRI